MRLICVTSPKSGCGASFCAVNLAKILSDNGHKCLVADLCFRDSSLDMYLGLTDGFVFNLSDVLKGRCTFEDAVVSDVMGENFRFACTSTLENTKDVNVSDYFALINTNAAEYDFVIADISANMLEKSHSHSIDTILYITDPQKSSVTILERYVHTLELSCSAYLIVNKVVPDLISLDNAVNIDDICDSTYLSPIGIIPWEPEIMAYANLGIPSTTNMSLLSTKSFLNIVERLQGNKVCSVDFEYKTPYYKKIKNITYRRNL